MENNILTEAELAEYFAYLDDLRGSGVTNMFGAGHYLQEEYGLDRAASTEVMSLWMGGLDPAKSARDRAKEAKATGEAA